MVARYIIKNENNTTYYVDSTETNQIKNFDVFELAMQFDTKEEALDIITYLVKYINGLTIVEIYE